MGPAHPSIHSSKQTFTSTTEHPEPLAESSPLASRQASNRRTKTTDWRRAVQLARPRPSYLVRGRIGLLLLLLLPRLLLDMCRTSNHPRRHIIPWLHQLRYADAYTGCGVRLLCVEQSLIGVVTSLGGDKGGAGKDYGRAARGGYGCGLAEQRNVQ